jgi:hypothetical protein
LDEPKEEEQREN